MKAQGVNSHFLRMCMWLENIGLRFDDGRCEIAYMKKVEGRMEYCLACITKYCINIPSFSNCS
jgi:hypothetical protein